MNHKPAPDLGSKVAIYPFTHDQKRKWIIFGLAGIVLVLFPLAYGLYRGFFGFNRYGIVAAIEWGKPWFLIAGGIAVLLIVFIVAQWIFTQKEIILFEKGLILRSNGFSQTLAMDEITGISTDVVASSSQPDNQGEIRRVSIYAHLGRQIRLNGRAANPYGIQNLPELTTRLKSTLYPKLLPKFHNQLLSGEKVQFGKISIQKDYLITPFKKKTLWTELQHVTIQSGYLVVELKNLQSSRRNPIQERYPISRVPNLELLLELIREFSC